MLARFPHFLRLTSAGLAVVLGAGLLGCNAVFGIEEGTLGAGPATWSRIFGGAGPTETNGDQWIHAVAVSAAGDVFVTGGFLESIRFDTGQVLTNTAPASEGSAGGPDAFLAKH